MDDSDYSEEGEEEVEEADAADQQSAELNRQFAEVRRRAERAARRKYEKQYANKQSALDRQIAERFKGYTNPETGAPIRTAADYMEALAAQDRTQYKAQMKEAGIDPSILDKAIAQSPVVRHARQVERENNQYKAKSMISADMKEIIAFDPSITSPNDVFTQPNFHEVVRYIEKHPGTRMSDAYKLVNFDRLSEARLKAGEQAAINQAKSKDHLKVATGTSDRDKSVDIPSSQLDLWKRAFPDKSPKELKALYNKAK